METNQPKPHAIMIPIAFQGHINPFTYLAMKLASNGFTITFVNSHHIQHQITKSKLSSTAQEQGQNDIFAAAREAGLDIRYRTVSDGFPLSFNRFQNHDQLLEGAIHVFPAHIDELVGDLMKSDPSINCLIADTFHVWPLMIANKHNLINISFWTEPALVFNMYYHLDLLIKDGHFGCHDKCEDTIDYLPGVQAFEPKDLMSHLHITDTSNPMLRIVTKAFREVKRADFILCNTVQELEAETLSVLQDKQPTYAIGPVFPPELNTTAVDTNLMPVIDCTEWLKTKPQGSVLYISFGSYCQVTKEEFEEMAQGILLSNVSFIWVLRPNILSYEEEGYALPSEFEDKTSDRGLMVPWCSQFEVLSNPAIGGFLTHCGWNSILESMWLGVPMLCFPILTDQFTNRKLVVDDWKIGLNLCDRKPMTRLEIAHKVKVLMNIENLGDGVLHRKIKKAKQTLKDALAPNGSSQQSLGKFINDVKAKIRTRI